MPARSESDPPLSVSQCATMACLLEVSSPKPGNVHRSADFEDVTFVDFVASAVAIGPAMEQARSTGPGRAVLEAIRATRRLVNTNTNLGTVLLLAPMAAVPWECPLSQGIDVVLANLTPQDAAAIYLAIRAAQPGGLGNVARLDVSSAAPADILEAMREAAQRDIVARQYVTNFATVLDEVTPSLVAGPGRGWSLADTIIQTQMQLMSRYPDSLIARKCGPETAREASVRAARILDCGQPGDEQYFVALDDFDFWLRSDHHRRNPGTTADLLAAGLFVALRDGLLRPPYL